MGIFTDWLQLREDNARKRAVKAALNGGPVLPGSAATCPSTNPAAMQVANKKGVVSKKIDEDKKPDYSFDRWLEKALKLGDDIEKIVKDGDKEDEKLDKKKQELEKDKPEDKEDPKEEKEKSWTDLKIKKDSSKEPAKKQGTSSSC